MAVISPSTSSTNAIHKSMAVTDVRKELTTKYSTRKFAMEYGGYLSNHLLHGVVALFELGAPKEQIEAFAEHYAKEKLETTAYDHEDPFEMVVAVDTSDAPVIPSTERVKELLGKREDFDALLAFYAHEVKLHGTDEAIRKHLSTMIGGLCGALLHGLIQLGYAYHIGGDRLIAEGLAYLHFSYLSFEDKDDYKKTSEPLNEDKKKQFTREEALSVAHAVKNHEFILSEMHKQLETAPFADLPIGIYQRNLNALSAHPERASAAAFQLIASTLDQFDFSNINGDVALDFSLWLYTMIEHNDFVIAHAVTSAWSLKQLEHLLSHDDRVRAWKVWFRVAVSAFIQQQVTDLSAEDICDRAVDLELSTLDSWTEIVGRTLALEETTDEHVYKVVQVAHEHAICDAKSSFLTPEEREFVARKAASKVIAIDFQRP